MSFSLHQKDGEHYLTNHWGMGRLVELMQDAGVDLETKRSRLSYHGEEPANLGQ